MTLQKGDNILHDGFSFDIVQQEMVGTLIPAEGFVAAGNAVKQVADLLGRRHNVMGGGEHEQGSLPTGRLAGSCLHEVSRHGEEPQGEAIDMVRGVGHLLSMRGGAGDLDGGFVDAGEVSQADSFAWHDATGKLEQGAAADGDGVAQSGGGRG